MGSRKKSVPLCDKFSSHSRKFLKEKNINASLLQIWEVRYFMCTHYSSEPGLKELAETPTIEELLINSFHFVFPDGVPEYLLKFSDKTNQWENVASRLVKNFLKEKKYKWLKETFIVDYTNVDENGDRIEQKLKEMLQQELALMKIDVSGDLSCDPYPNFHGMNLMQKFDKLFKNDMINIMTELSYKTTTDELQQYEAIKDAVYELLSFGEISLHHKGAARVDFQCKGIRGRSNNTFCVKIKPDGVLYHFGYSPCLLEPCCALKVYGPNEKIHDTDDNLVSTMQDSTMFHHEEAISFYENIQQHKVIEDEIKAMGPKIVNTSYAAQKFYAELNTEMYGILMQKNKNLKEYFNESTYSKMLLYYSKDSQKLKLGCLGLFVMNQDIILAKLSHSLMALDSANIAEGPSFRCAENWWFNLQKPNDRIAFIIFLRTLLRFRTYNNKKLLQLSMENELGIPDLSGIIYSFSSESLSSDTIF